MAICSNDEVFALLGKTPNAAETAMMNILRPMAEDAVRSEVGYSIEQATYTHYLPEQHALIGEQQSVDVLNDRVIFEYEGEERHLYLPERPVRSITSVYEDRAAYGGQGDNDFAAATLLMAGTDYFLDYTVSGVSWPGRLIRINAGWSPKERTIKVTYVAGVTAAELSGDSPVRGPCGSGVTQLKYAALLASAIAFKEPQTIQGTSLGPITGERLADYSVQYDAKQVSSLFGFKMALPQKVRELLNDFKRRDI